MRILITGSRDWDDEQLIEDALEFWSELATGQQTTLISGACPTGADAIAEKLAERWGWTIERHPADWSTHGKRAGYLRNKEMVDSKPDLCVGFVKNNSRGATMTLRLAEEAGIPTRRYDA